MAALQSAMLNGEATVFRRNYYINGSHAGVIVYLTDPIANNKDVEKPEEVAERCTRRRCF
jgi:capsid portal protein